MLGLGMAWLKIIGLIFDSTGAVFLAAGLVVRKARAVELGVSRFAGNTVEENLQLAPVREILHQSKRAVIGGGLLVVGFILQMIGNWPT